MRRYSRKTEKAYVHWIRRFIVFHGKRHPAELDREAISGFLSNLATARRVGASTQNQALSALLFLYRGVLGRDLEYIEGVVRAKTARNLPVVLTKLEVRTLLGVLAGVPSLMATLLYGSGLRLMECCRLRIKDVDFTTKQILVRNGKGNKDRHTVLPERIATPLWIHVQKVARQHGADVRKGLGAVSLSGALATISKRREGTALAMGVSRQPVLPRPRPESGENITSMSPCFSAPSGKRASKRES
jgi:integrase